MTKQSLGMVLLAKQAMLCVVYILIFQANTLYKPLVSYCYVGVSAKKLPKGFIFISQLRCNALGNRCRADPCYVKHVET